MKTNNQKTRGGSVLSLATATALLMGVSEGSAAQFLLRIADRDGATMIPGESEAVSHHDWIDVHAFGTGARRVKSADGTTGGSLEAHDFSFHKRIDKSTPLLQKACFTGLLLPAVQIKYNEESLGTPNVQSPLSVELHHVGVTGYHTNSTGEGIPTEEISLNYTEIEWTYIQRDEKGNDLDVVTTEFALFLATEDPGFDDDNDGIHNGLDSDDDNDGIPDEAEVRLGSDPFFDDADEDLDGDGQSNSVEAIANTKMNDASDYFGIQRIRRSMVPNAAGEMEARTIVSFPVSGGRHYRLLASPDPSLPKDAWIVLDEFDHPEGSPEDNADIELSPRVTNNASRIFFRVEVELVALPLIPTPGGG